MRRHSVAFLVLAATLAAPGAGAATLVINNLDGAGEGFNDPTPAAPTGGNTGTTLGAQRLIAVQHAANAWGALLGSAITVRVDASVDPLTCSASSGVLASAGALTVAKDFSGAPLANRWYPAALANSLAGSDLDAATADIRMYFNASLGGASCLPGAAFYLGLD